MSGVAATCPAFRLWLVCKPPAARISQFKPIILCLMPYRQTLPRASVQIPGKQGLQVLHSGARFNRGANARVGALLTGNRVAIGTKEKMRSAAKAKHGFHGAERRGSAGSGAATLLLGSGLSLATLSSAVKLENCPLNPTARYQTRALQ